MAMHIPSQFYYSASQSSVCHSRTPTGNLAIKELIAGQPCWVLPTLPRIDKQKKLILADWTASNWSHKKINDVKTRLGELIEQGFDIYIWQAGQVIPMRTDLLARSELYTMSMASVDEVTQAAMAQHKLTYDEIQVIDDYWLNHLVNDTEALAPRVLRISEISVLKPEAMDKLVVMLNKATPELSAIINDIYSVFA